MEDKRVIYQSEDGTLCIIVPAPEATQEEVLKAVPPDTIYEIVDVSTIPSDRTFRNAWEKSGKSIIHNIQKCRTITHDIRREKRSKEFAPLDIEATIPSKAQAAEASREVIRQKYAQLQTEIDSSQSVEELKVIFNKLKE